MEKKEKEGKERSDQRRREGLLSSAVREGWESQREERLSSSSLSSSLKSKTQRPGRSSSKEPIGKERGDKERGAQAKAMR